MFSQTDKTSKQLWQSAPNQLALKSLLIFAVASTAFCGCNVGKFPTSLSPWKKDNIRLSGNHQEGVAPPSRSFDPAPSQFAQAGSATKPGSSTKQNVGESEVANKPIRQPYGSGSATKEPSTKPAEQVASGFGFPAGSDSMFGNKDKQDFSVPNAQDFRQAMKNATQNAAQSTTQFANNATRSAENAFQSTRNISAETFNKALSPINQVTDSAKSGARSLSNKTQQAVIDFTGGGDFAAKPSTTFNNPEKGLEVAGQFVPAEPAVPATPNTGSGGWNNDFAMTPSSQRVKNQFVDSGFNASVEQANREAQQSLKQFNQQAAGRFNAIKSENGFLATKAAEFKTDASTASKQFQPPAAPAPTVASAPANQFNNRIADTRVPSFQPNPQPPTTQPTQPAPATNQFVATGANQFQVPSTQTQAPPTPPAPRNQFAQTNRNGFTAQPTQPQPTTPKRHILPTTTPTELARKAQQMRERIEGATEPASQTADNTIQATNDVVGNAEPNVPVGYTQGGRYPTTNYGAYSGRERVSQVTPIEPVIPIPNQPILRAQPGSTLPTGIQNSGGSYAPGSVKSFSPIH